MTEVIDNIEKLSKSTAMILASGYGFPQIAKMLKDIAEAQIQNELEQKFKGIEVQENNHILDIFNELRTGYCVDMIENISQYELPAQNISSLKKRIKYCKNPMEKKKLQQELNVLYKEQKNIRRFEASVSLDGERRIY
jgi:hypothetical protein|nr:MAG TPA: hypothetical protein [Bacteriophage sp.]